MVVFFIPSFFYGNNIKQRNLFQAKCVAYLKTHGCARIGNPLRFNPADNAYGCDTNR